MLSTAAREQLRGVSVRVAVEREDLSLQGDRSLLLAMLTQFVDNAAKYAEAGTTVTITAAEQSSAVVLSVHNRGPPFRPRIRSGFSIATSVPPNQPATRPVRASASRWPNRRPWRTEATCG